MADPLTTFDIVSASAVIVALVAGVSALWSAFSKRVAYLETLRSQDKTEMAELIRRVRKLEDDRVQEVKEYAKSLESMNKQQSVIFARSVAAVQGIAKIVTSILSRPCMKDAFPPGQAPDVSTDTLMRNEERVMRQHQQASACP